MHLPPIAKISWTPAPFPTLHDGIFPDDYAYWFTTILRALRLQSLPLLEKLAAAWNLGADIVLHGLTEDLPPAWCTMTYPDGIFIFIHGTNNVKQTTSYILGGVLVASGAGGGLVNRGFKVGADLLDDDLRPLLDSVSLPFCFAGHSYGGAIAQVLAERFERIYGLDRSRGVFTIGCSKVGDAGFAADLHTTVLQLENVDDPIPYMPPAGLVFLTISPYSVRFPIGQSLYVHAGARYGLDAEARLYAGRGELESREAQGQILLGLLRGETSVILPHFANAYARRLRVWLGRFGSSWRENWRDSWAIDRVNDELDATGH